MTVTDLYYDPYDYTIDEDPYPVWKRLRDEAPVYWNERHGFYALSRYDDVLNGLLDIDTFRSGHGIVLEMIGDEPYENIPMMIMKDPPEHTRLRKLVSRAFTPRRIADLERRIAKLCNDLFETVDGQDEFDYIGDVRRAAAAHGDPRTGRLSRRLRGRVPRTSRQQPAHRGRRHDADGTGSIARWSPRTVRSRTRRSGSCRSSWSSGARTRKTTSSAGWCTRRSTRTVRLRTLTLEEIVGFVQLISSAGTETVARLLGFAAVTLAQHPDQRQLLVDDPSLVPNAIEELLRYEAPSPIQSRWVSRDVELHDTVIPRGSRLALAQRFRRPRRAPLRGSRPVRRAAGDRPAPRVRLRHPLLRRGRAGAPRGHGRAHRDAAAVPDLGDRREPARAGAHEHRARLHARCRCGCVDDVTGTVALLYVSRGARAARLEDDRGLARRAGIAGATGRRAALAVTGVSERGVGGVVKW